MQLEAKKEDDTDMFLNLFDTDLDKTIANLENELKPTQAGISDGLLKLERKIQNYRKPKS